VKLPPSLALPKEAQSFLACVSGPRSVRPFLPVMLFWARGTATEIVRPQSALCLVAVGLNDIVLFHSQTEITRRPAFRAQSGTEQEAWANHLNHFPCASARMIENIANNANLGFIKLIERAKVVRHKDHYQSAPSESGALKRCRIHMPSQRRI
jgi:hypothetical protein